MTDRISVARVRDDLAETLNQVAYRGDRLVIERRGKDVAALVPIKDLELIEALEDRIDEEAAEAALEEIRFTGTVPWERIKERLGL
jgi:prevent-host-death family protein